MTSRPFHSPSWLLLLQVLMQVFEIIPSVHSYLNKIKKTAPKSDRFH